MMVSCGKQIIFATIVIIWISMVAGYPAPSAPAPTEASTSGSLTLTAHTEASAVSNEPPALASPALRNDKTATPHNRAMTITNLCAHSLWPGILTTNNSTGPFTHGFMLPPGHGTRLSVGEDWVGRVWARTNCAFDEFGRGGCETGDCGGLLDCAGISGTPPTTLAEFGLRAHGNQSYYDISLVDGYSLNVKIIPDHNPAPGSGINHADLSPSCVATNTEEEYAQMCPGGPPCLSACMKWGRPEDCCTGDYATPETCKASQQSKSVKGVCGDAYSYAYDDKTSLFTVPAGPGEGFEIMFCPTGKSTNIMGLRKSLEGTALQSTPQPQPQPQPQTLATH